MVHGDDFLAWETQDKLGKVLSEAYELKCFGILRDDDGDRREAHFLNRLIRVDEKSGRSSVAIEADRVWTSSSKRSAWKKRIPWRRAA